MSEDSLVYFSVAFIIVLVGVISVGFLRQRGDLLDVRSLLLLGAVDFVGISTIILVYYQKPYTAYSKSDYLTYAAGVTVFFTTMLLAYSWWKLPRRLGGKAMLSWPPASPGALLLMILLCFIPQLLLIACRGIPVVGQILALTSRYGPIFAGVLAISFWLQQKKNPIAFVIMLGTLGVALIAAVAVGSGRRWLVAVLLSVPITVYWVELRYRSRIVTLAVSGVLAVSSVFLLNGWSFVRHEFRDTKKPKTVANTVSYLNRSLSKSFDFGQINQILGQDTANCSLLTIAYKRQKRFDVSPFHSVLFVVTNPIPRSWWPDKPKGFGYLLPQEVYHSPYKQVTWGPGIVGHGFHEGGLLMLVFYGVLVGGAARFCDSLLNNQPNNPYLLGWLVAVSGQLIGWTRGDIGTFTLQIIAVSLFTLGLVVVGWILMGSGLRYHTEDVRNAAEYYLRQRRLLSGAR